MIRFFRWRDVFKDDDAGLPWQVTKKNLKVSFAVLLFATLCLCAGFALWDRVVVHVREPAVTHGMAASAPAGAASILSIPPKRSGLTRPARMSTVSSRRLSTLLSRSAVNCSVLIAVSGVESWFSVTLAVRCIQYYRVMCMAS
ncbi:hypothetical protein B0E50_01275 [Rhodanobacter sp. C01]|nr:hypothetical protein B0E50_01275 [Rhodanobacter sp. C01]